MGCTFQLPHPVRGATGVEGQAAQTATLFQLTRPVRGATDIARRVLQASRISAPTPRTGCGTLFRGLIGRLQAIPICTPCKGYDRP